MGKPNSFYGVSIVPSSHLFPKSLTMCHARSAWWLETKSYAPRKPRHRLASLGNPKKKKCSLLFLIFAGVIFSKMERTFFFLGFCPPSIRAVWRGFNADSAKRKSFFLGERIFRFASTDFPPAGGVWGGMRAGFQTISFLSPKFMPVENWRTAD